MRVRITRPTFLRGAPVLAGQELEVSQAEGMGLIGAGKAIPLKDTQVETADLPRAAIETADKPPVPEPPAEQEEAEEPAKPKRGKARKVSK